MHSASLFVCLALGAAQIPAVVIERDTILAGSNGYVIGPPIFVAGPADSLPYWSPTGKNLAALVRTVPAADRIRALKGEPVRMGASVLVWNRITGQVQTLMSSDVQSLSIHGWLGRTDSLIFQLVRKLPSGPQRREPEMIRELYRWNPSDSRATLVWTSNADYELDVSYRQPYAAIQTPGNQVLLIGTTGVAREIAPDAEVAKDSDGFFYLLVKNGWLRALPDGSIAKIEGFPRTAAPGLRVPDVRFRGENPIPVDPNGLQVGMTTTPASYGGSQTKVQSAWLWAPDQGKVKASLLAAEASRVVLCQQGDAVAYLAKENLFVREVTKMPASELDKILEEAEKRELVSRAKQVGTGMAIYCADADDLFPPNAGWQDVLMPYLRDRNLVEGFVYQLNGESATAIADPASRPIGYIQGRYGRAIVFADTHTIWEPKRRP